MSLEINLWYVLTVIGFICTFLFGLFYGYMCGATKEPIWNDQIKRSALQDQKRYQYLRRTTKAVHMDDGYDCINPTEAEFDAAIDRGIAQQ